MIRSVSVQHAMLGGLLIALVSNATWLMNHGEVIYFIGVWVSIAAMINIALAPHRFDDSENWYAKSFYAPWFVVRDYRAYVKERAPLIAFLEQADKNRGEALDEDYTKVSIQDLRLLHKLRITQ